MNKTRTKNKPGKTTVLINENKIISSKTNENKNRNHSHTNDRKTKPFDRREKGPLHNRLCIYVLTDTAMPFEHYK